MYHQQYNPRYPPPINFYPNLEFSNLKNSEPINYITNNDQVWLEIWLAKRKSASIQINKTSVRVTRQIFIESQSTIKRLQNIKTYLKENIELLTSKEWNSKIHVVDALKVQLRNKFSIFNNTDTLKAVQKHIYKRKMKRLHQHQKWKTAQGEKKLSFKNRFTKHEKNYALLCKMKKTLESSRQIEKRIRDTDAVLYDVKTRISEANHWLNIIENLRTLRAARHTAASGRNENVDLSDSKTFSKIMDELCIMWKSRLEKYHTEELELKSSLAKKESSVQDKNKPVFKEWESIFWGQLKDSNDDKLFKFIAIRRKWDFYTVPESNELGSKIPIGWVLPERQSADWEKYIVAK